MKRLTPEKQAGIYLTVIAHLAALIILLATGLGSAIRGDGSFVVDFTGAEQAEQAREETEQLARREELLQRINERLDEQIQSSQTSGPRNVAVDRAALQDDRGTDAEQLYRDAARLDQELKNGFEIPEDNDDDISVSSRESAEEIRKDTPESKYTGPSVISYELEGRKASSLPIPAYRCMGGGQVTVKIIVNPAGKVLDAKVDDKVSAGDECLRAYAVRAARLSRFSASTGAPARQEGTIVYEFIAQ